MLGYVQFGVPQKKAQSLFRPEFFESMAKAVKDEIATRFSAINDGVIPLKEAYFRTSSIIRTVTLSYPSNSLHQGRETKQPL